MTAITPTHTQVGDRLFDLANLDPAMMEPAFLIPEMARLARFNGQTIIRNHSDANAPPRHFTVLHHTAAVVELLRQAGHSPGAAPALFIAAILHDAAELFTGDIPTPFKRMLDPQAFEEAEWPIVAAIMRAGGLTEDEATEILEGAALKAADRTAGMAEAACYMPHSPATRDYWTAHCSTHDRAIVRTIAGGPVQRRVNSLLHTLQTSQQHLHEWRATRTRERVA